MTSPTAAFGGSINVGGFPLGGGFGGAGREEGFGVGGEFNDTMALFNAALANSGGLGGGGLAGLVGGATPGVGGLIGGATPGFGGVGGLIGGATPGLDGGGAFDPTKISPLLGSKGGFDPGINYNDLLGLPAPIAIGKGAPPQIGAGGRDRNKVMDVSGLFGGV